MGRGEWVLVGFAGPLVGGVTVLASRELQRVELVRESELEEVRSLWSAVPLRRVSAAESWEVRTRVGSYTVVEATDYVSALQVVFRGWFPGG